jgi:dipeptidyl aminopeptidase/acylaminoacyl peptidase
MSSAASCFGWEQEPMSKAQVERVLSEVGSGKRLGPVAISPDGQILAFVREEPQGWRVRIAPMSAPEKGIIVTASKKADLRCSESKVEWAPDSRRLAFVGNCENEHQEDVFLATIGGEFAEGRPHIAVERLTSAKGEVGYPSFSPNGNKIAFLYVEGATRPAGALAAMKPWAGVIGEDGVEVQRIAMVDASAHKAQPVMSTPAGLHAYEFDWRPDSQGLTYIGANPPGENNWWLAKLYTQELGAEPKAIYSPENDTGPMHGLQMAVPRWSPDGKQIAFIGGLMSDQGSTGGDVWIIGSEGGEPRNATSGARSTAMWLTWGASASELYVSRLSGGNAQLMRLAANAQNKSDEHLIYSVQATVGDGRLEMSLSSTQDRKVFVFNASSFDRPMEMYAAHAGPAAMEGFDGLRQLSRVNAGVAPAWGKVDSLNWTNDGFSVQGWLLHPRNFDPGKKYPLIVLVHGGPSAAAMPSWGGRGSLSGQAFSALGYFVLEANPRGSFGQGEAFTAANRKDFGYGDLRDILAGVDTVLAKYPVDPDRVGLTGWSYGGFMTMFAVTQTNRFKAAVAGAGIANWQSYYGENSIDQWMIPFFGATVYRDPAVYAKSSAIDFIDKVKTPVLVVVGDRDGECPAPQSFEFWHALRDQHVPTQLVVYPNEGHGFVSQEHRTDVLLRAVEWFAKYMPAAQ